MTTFYDVQSLLRQNMMIVKGRPHHWHTVSRFTLEPEARAYLKILRKGARDLKNPYNYRLKTVEV